MLLAVTGWAPGVWREQFALHAPQRPIIEFPEGEGNSEIRYAVVWKQRPGLLATLPNLEVIFSIGAGVDHVFRDPGLPDVPIVRIVADDLTLRMSEYVVWQVLDHLRQGAAYRARQAGKIWGELPQPAASEITVGIMGIGQLGKDAAVKLMALGFRVTGWSRTEKAMDGVTLFNGRAGLPEFLGSADIVVVLLPLTAQTRGIINAEMLAMMKRQTPLGGPVLINAGRGGLQVERDLLEALDSKRLMAASLDVFETEPLPADSPLWSHPKVFVTPHAAASSDPRALAPLILQQMADHEAGKPLCNLVDRDAGY